MDDYALGEKHGVTLALKDPGNVLSLKCQTFLQLEPSLNGHYSHQPTDLVEGGKLIMYANSLNHGFPSTVSVLGKCLQSG